MTDADAIREQQRATWEHFSGGWAKWDGLVRSQLGPVGDEMIRALALREDGRHLDVASGTGEPGLSIAARLPRGHVVLSDLSSGMLAAATANASARGLQNVEVLECGVDTLPFADASFDTISCRFGLMFFPDIAASVGALARLLRQGGHIVLAVWAEPAGNPWATIPMAAIGAEVDLPDPQPDEPSLFRCATPGAITGIVRDVGLRDAVETDVYISLDPESADEYWEYLTEVPAAVVAGLARADESGRDRIRGRVVADVREFEVNGRPKLPGHARCIVATK